MWRYVGAGATATVIVVTVAIVAIGLIILLWMLLLLLRLLLRRRCLAVGSIVGAVGGLLHVPVAGLALVRRAGRRRLLAIMMMGRRGRIIEAIGRTRGARVLQCERNSVNGTALR